MTRLREPPGLLFWNRGPDTEGPLDQTEGKLY
jgi:hypothetical protein